MGNTSTKRGRKDEGRSEELWEERKITGGDSSQKGTKNLLLIGKIKRARETSNERLSPCKIGGFSKRRSRKKEQKRRGELSNSVRDTQKIRFKVMG